MSEFYDVLYEDILIDDPTKGAIFVEIDSDYDDGLNIWIPRSVIGEINMDDSTIQVKAWFADEHGLDSYAL